MTNSTLRSAKDWESRLWFDSHALEGVRYEIVRISFGRRIELARRIREIGRKMEYLEAGGDPREKLEATVLAAEIDKVYLEWGLISVEGLEIDSVTATVGSLLEDGPVELATEILGTHQIRMRDD